MSPPVPDDYEWIIYVRISDDREGRGLGVKRQEKLGRDLHRGVDLGGRILTVCIDNDLTAYDRSGRYKPRDDYDRMVALLRERPGRRGVITYHTDRLHRTPRELEDFIDTVEATGAAIQTVKAGELDLSTASGRMTARVHCAVARHESEHKSERIRAKVDELAAEGKIGNGGPRPFGYRRIYGAGEGRRRKILRDELHEDEALIVRDCARRFLAGQSLRTIAVGLNLRGVPTSTGKHWTMQALRWMLRSGRIAGLREHHGQVVAKAVWPAIIGEDTHRLLRARLDSHERPPGSRVRVHYLTGFVQCDNPPCLARGIRMKVQPGAAGTLKYVCPPPPDGGCNGRVIGLVPLRELVDARMVERLADPQTLRDLAAREAVADDAAAGILAQIEADERRLALLADTLTDGAEDDLPEVVATVRRLRRRVRSAREELARRANLPTIVREVGPDLAARWQDLDLTQKRTLLGLFVARIVIKPGRRGLGRFDPDRVVIDPVRVG